MRLLRNVEGAGGNIVHGSVRELMILFVIEMRGIATVPANSAGNLFM